MRQSSDLSLVILDLIDLIVAIFCVGADPFDLASVLPLSLLLHSVFTYVGPDTMLFAGLPFADVFASIGPYESAVAFSLIVDELPGVHLPVFPFELALAVHLVLAPVAGV